MERKAFLKTTKALLKVSLFCQSVIVQVVGIVCMVCIVSIASKSAFSSLPVLSVLSALCAHDYVRHGALIIVCGIVRCRR